MIKTVLRHYLWDAGITAFFDGLITNFSTSKQVSYLGKYIMACDDDSVICAGLVIQEEDRLMVVEDEDHEYIVSKDLWDIEVLTKEEWETIEYDDDDDETLIEWLKTHD